MSTPSLHLQTLFALDAQNRIVSTREPHASRGPIFALVRGPRACAWAVRVDVAPALAATFDRLAATEPPVTDLATPPRHAARYRALARQHAAAATGAPAALHLFSGPAFTFPAASPVPHQPDDAIVSIDDERLLAQHFSGWIPGEIAAGRGPLLARLVDGVPVSICFCARRSDVAAEAGLETAPSFRGRGYAAHVTAAWAAAVRAGGRIPLYSTAWDNQASQAVARKLALIAYAGTWSLSDA